MPFVARLLLPLLLLGAAVVTSPSAAALPGYVACPPEDSLGFDIAGDITCDEAAKVAVGYDPAGDKYQVVHNFTCYSVAPDVYPIVYTCVRGVDEIVVSKV
jgi:hypothetical protein